MRSLLPLSMIAALAGCWQDTACTMEARASVQITLTDATDGLPLAGASVSYVTEGTSESCEEMGAGEYVCGWEVDGLLSLSISKDGYLSHTEDVLVEADECHVETQQIAVALTPGVECLDDGMAPSLMIAVNGVGLFGEDVDAWPINDATVTFSADGIAEEACDHAIDNQWACGWEVSGELTWRASAENYTTATGTVTVGIDESGCHVQTVHTTAVLECLNCFTTP